MKSAEFSTHTNTKGQMMQKQVKQAMVLMASLLALNAHALLCVESSDLPTALQNTVDIVGAFPEEELPKTVKKIKNIGLGANTLQSLNNLCIIVQNKDWFNGFLYLLPQIAEFTAPEVAPFVTVITDVASKEVEAIKMIGGVIGAGRLNDPEIPATFSVAMTRPTHWWWPDADMSASEISKHVAYTSLVYALKDHPAISFDTTNCIEDTKFPCRPGWFSTKVAVYDQAIPDNTWVAYMKIVFKNKQWFLIPLTGTYSSYNAASSSPAFDMDYSVPFLWKNGRYYYNKK